MTKHTKSINIPRRSQSSTSSKNAKLHSLRHGTLGPREPSATSLDDQVCCTPVAPRPAPSRIPEPMHLISPRAACNERRCPLGAPHELTSFNPSYPTPARATPLPAPFLRKRASERLRGVLMCAVVVIPRCFSWRIPLPVPPDCQLPKPDRVHSCCVRLSVGHQCPVRCFLAYVCVWLTFVRASWCASVLPLLF